MNSPRRLSLLHRRGCHLCDDMLEALDNQLRGLDVAVVLVDIDHEPALAARFGADIPVLMAGNHEICRHRLDAGRLREWLYAACTD